MGVLGTSFRTPAGARESVKSVGRVSDCGLRGTGNFLSIHTLCSLQQAVNICQMRMRGGTAYLSYKFDVELQRAVENAKALVHHPYAR